MRVLTSILVATAAAAIVPSAHAGVKSCGAVRDVVPTGVSDIPALKIRAHNVSCATARALPAKVVLNARYGAMNPGAYSKRALGIAKWDCDLGGFGEKTVCTASGNRRVSWWLGEA
jgi:hypothetical protein